MPNNFHEMARQNVRFIAYTNCNKLYTSTQDLKDNRFPLAITNPLLIFPGTDEFKKSIYFYS